MDLQERIIFSAKTLGKEVRERTINAYVFLPSLMANVSIAPASRTPPKSEEKVTYSPSDAIAATLAGAGGVLVVEGLLSYYRRRDRKSKQTAALGGIILASVAIYNTIYHS